MLHSSSDLEIEAWVETLNDERKFAEHREASKADEITGREFSQHEAFLECEEGKSFRIRFRCIRSNGTRPSMSVTTEIDGRKIRGNSWGADWKGDVVVNRMYVMEDGENKIADLAFAALPKTDEEALVDVRGSAIDSLGKIKVSIQRGRHQRATESSIMLTDAAVGTVHEKQLKLGSTIQASNLRPSNGGLGVIFWPDEQDPEVCTFIWNYHTKAKLTIMGIIEEEAPASTREPIQSRSNPTASSSSTPVGTAVKQELNVEAGEAVVPKREREVEDEGEIEIVKKMRKDKKGPGSIYKPIMVTDGKFGAVGIVDLTED